MQLSNLMVHDNDLLVRKIKVFFSRKEIYKCTFGMENTVLMMCDLCVLMQKFRQKGSERFRTHRTLKTPLVESVFCV